MKQLYTQTLLTVFFGVLFTINVDRASAQLVSTYAYAYSSPTYSVITGTAVVSGVSSWNDNVYDTIPIGFTFYFEGQPYTQIGINSNGFIWFGTGVTNVTEYNPISDATLGTGAIAGVVSGYGTNLLAYPSTLSNAPSGTPDIEYTTTGAVGTRVFTVQWKGAEAAADPGSSGGFGDLERVDLQIKLDEGTNAISVLPHINPYPYLGSSSGQVGIRGTSNTDFQSLNVDCSTYRWNSVAADQSTNNAATGLLDPCYPATRSMFTWTPPVVSCPVTITSQASTNPCLGGDGTITIVATGGSPLTYKITTGGIVDSNTTGLFTGLSAGTYTVSVGNGTCSVNGTSIILANPTPIIASNNGPVCAGNTLNLSVTSVTGATYSWSGPNGFTSTSRTPSIANAVVADSGTYTVVDTVAGCISAPVTTHVVINPTPAAPTPVGSNSPVCVGATLNLSATAVGGATYHWTGPNGFSSTSLTPSVTNVVIADSGTYSVVDTVAGCVSAAATTHVVINPAPAAPTAGANSPVCVGGNLNLTASTILNATYSWTGPNGFTSNSQNPLTITPVVLADSGTYTVVDTVAGCVSQPATVHVVVNQPPVIDSVGYNSPLCAGTGQVLFLTSGANAGATYSWTGPNGFTASTQNTSNGNAVVSNSGYYTVTDSIPGCPPVSDSVLVVIGTGIGSITASNNGPVCDGQNLTLSASAVNGATYSWSGPNGFTSSQQDTTFIITSGNAGTYTVTVTTNGGTCGSSQDTTTVVVNQAPVTPIVGSNSPVCPGDTLSLTVAAQNGASYSWTGPNGFNSIQQNPSIAGVVSADSGQYIVTVSTGTCGSATDSTLAIINTGTPAVTATNNGPVCTGQTLQLNATVINGVSYSWTGPGGFIAQVPNPSISNISAADSGWYKVTITGTCGSSTDSTFVATSSSITAPVLGSNSPLCIGSTLELTCSPVPGASYRWSGPNGYSSNTQNATEFNVSVADSGVYSITVTVTGGCGSATASTNVSVVTGLPAPAITAINNPACEGTTLELITPALTNGSYEWTGPNNFIGVGDTVIIPNVDSTNSGTYNLNVSSGNCSGNSSISITVNATPLVKIISGQYCYGDTAVLDPGHFSTYSWSTGQTTEAISFIYNDTVITTGITVTDGNGCTASQNVLTLFLAKPDTTIIIQTGDTLMSSWTSAASYQWFLNGDSVVGATTDTLDITRSGNYSVVVTDSNGCSSTSFVYPAVTGINGVGGAGFFILYPNPASGRIYLASDREVESYVIYNPEGQEVARTEGLRSKQATINIQNLAKGVYILQALIGEEKVTLRFAVME